MTRSRACLRPAPAILAAGVAAIIGWGLLATPAGAFELTGSRWPGATAPFRVSIVSPFDGAAAPSGISWDAAFAEAAAAWREESGFDFVLSPLFADPCELRPGRNGTTFRLIACGDEFGDSTLAVTFSFFDGPRLLETDVVFNGWLAWDVYRGRWRASAPEFRRVALHELGHALGLDHESRAASIMRPTAGNLETLQADDRAAVAVLYGGCERFEPLTETVDVTGRLEPTDCFLSERLEGAAPILFDAFALALPEGGLLEASLASTDFDAELTLARVNALGEIADVLARDDSSGGGPLGTDARLALLLAPGEYRLLASARHEGATGEYRLRATLVPEPSAFASGAGVLAALVVLAAGRPRRASDA